MSKLKGLHLENALNIVDALEDILRLDLTENQREGYQKHLAYWRGLVLDRTPHESDSKPS